MDWLTSYFAKVDCHYKLVKFKFLGEPSFVIYRHNNPMSMKVMSIMTRRMLRQEGQGHLVMIEDILMDKRSLDSVPIIDEYSDVFLNEPPRLPPKSKIKFCIDLV